MTTGILLRGALSPSALVSLRFITNSELLSLTPGKIRLIAHFFCGCSYQSFWPFWIMKSVYLKVISVSLKLRLQTALNTQFQNVLPLCDVTDKWKVFKVFLDTQLWSWAQKTHPLAVQTLFVRDSHSEEIWLQWRELKRFVSEKISWMASVRPGTRLKKYLFGTVIPASEAARKFAY